MKANQNISVFYEKHYWIDEIPIAWLKKPSQKRVKHHYRGRKDKAICDTFCDTLKKRKQIVLDYTPYKSESEKFGFELGKLTIEFFFVNGDVKITNSFWQDLKGKKYDVITDADCESTLGYAEALENRKHLVAHMRRERSPRLKAAKLRSARKNNKLHCELCGLGVKLKSLFDKFPVEDILEVHHDKPLSEKDGPTVTTLDDLVILCPNCHRTIHRSKVKKGQILSVENFKRLHLR